MRRTAKGLHQQALARAQRQRGAGFQKQVAQVVGGTGVRAVQRGPDTALGHLDLHRPVGQEMQRAPRCQHPALGHSHIGGVGSVQGGWGQNGVRGHGALLFGQSTDKNINLAGNDRSATLGSPMKSR
jgi:hypothetical protein